MTKEELVIESLYRCQTKWAKCISQMVGNLYPEIARMRYIYPINKKITQLKYHPKYKHIDFYKIFRKVQ